MSNKIQLKIGGSYQAGVAVLAVTIIILLVATIGTLVIGRVGVVEQKAVGADTRSKEVYSATIGGLEYGVNWFMQTGSYPSLQWSDEDGDGLAEAGDTASPPALANTALNTGTYSHTITYRLMTDLAPEEYEDRDGEGVANDLVNIRPVIVRVESLASPVSVNNGAADTQIQKSTFVDIVVNGKLLFNTTSGDPGEFTGPPILIEGCIGGTITGNPSVNYDIDLSNPEIIDIAIASTTMNADNDGDGSPDHTLDTCMPGTEMEGHLTFCDIDQYPTSCPNNADMDSGDALADPNVPEFRMGLPEPDSLWNTIFGASTTKEDLLTLEALEPLDIIVVDSSTLHHSEQTSAYSWNGQQWHQNLGTADNPVILFFDEDIDCPAINGSTVIYGLVYYEKEVCDNNGWGGGTIYGTVAKSGDLTGLNSNAEIIATGLDFGGGAGSGAGTGDNYQIVVPVMSVFPGSWRDFSE